MGTKFSYQPKIGIPIATSTINDPRSHYSDYISSACYLAYRCLDGTYEDIKYAWECLCKAESMIEDLLNKEKIWFVSRWSCSLSIAKIYMKMCCLKEDIPVEDLKKLANSNYSILYPPQIVNVLRANSMLVLNYFVENNIDAVNEQIYGITLPVFSKSMSLYKITKKPENRSDISRQMLDVAECITFIFKVRDSFNAVKLTVLSDPYQYQHRRCPLSKNDVSWINNEIIKNINTKFKEPYYKSMKIILEKLPNL